MVKQRKQPIRVVLGNPPYSAQQESENDNNKNLLYPRLDEKIRQSYAARSNAKLLKNLYDSYIRAIRWASDRIKDNGIVCFVSNGSFIDANNMDGLRKCLVDEFTSIYCFNLRGNQRTSGERSRQEGGKIFGSGSRAPIAITLLVKNPANAGQHALYYHDIGDYLSREDKLKIISEFASYRNIDWRKLRPNQEGDWIGQRSVEFQKFIPLGDKSDEKSVSFFDLYSLGVVTNRDAWAYNFSSEELAANMRRMIAFFNAQSSAFQRHKKTETYRRAIEDKKDVIGEFVDTDPRKISWTHNLKTDLAKGAIYDFDNSAMVTSPTGPSASSGSISIAASMRGFIRFHVSIQMLTMGI